MFADPSAHLLTAPTHFGHRESADIVVDLFWSRRNVGDAFRVEVEDRREGVRFVLHPTTGKEAIQAFHHPFAVTGSAPPRRETGGRPSHRPGGTQDGAGRRT